MHRSLDCNRWYQRWSDETCWQSCASVCHRQINEKGKDFKYLEMKTGCLSSSILSFVANVLHVTKAVVLKLFVAAEPFHCTQKLLGTPSFRQRFSIIEKLDLSLLSVSTSTFPARSKLRASAFPLNPLIAVTKINKKGQSTWNMNMSDCSCGAIKL